MSTDGFPVTDGVVTLLPPPAGYKVHFEHPRQQMVMEHYLIFGILGSLAFIALIQRYYTKIWLLRGLHVDDGFMFLGWLASIVTQAVLVSSIAEGGMCAHAWEMPLWKFHRYAVLSPGKWFRVAVLGSIALVSTYTTIITFMLLFQCSPVDKAFNPTVASGSCLEAGILYMATAVSNIVTDLILFALPLPMVYGLSMPMAQKVGVVIIFGIGSVTVATSVVRLVLLPPVLKSTDVSWDSAPADVWTFVEANLYVICGSMPTLRKFFGYFAPKLMDNCTSQSDGHSSETGHSRASHSKDRKPRRQYSQFSDEENEMEIFRGDLTPRRIGEGSITHISADPSVNWDAQSEKVILQTRSFTVEYD